MDLEQTLRSPLSRRRFVEATGVTFIGGSAVFVAACGGGSSTSTSTGAPPGGATGNADVDILNSALALEQTAVFAYTAGAALLSGAALAVGKQFLAQEKEHAAGLAKAVSALGGTPVKPKSDSEYKRALGLSKLKSATDVLDFASKLENVAVAAYVDAIPKLSSGDLRQTAAQIVTNEAEHISVLALALKRDPVPAAFVTGDANALPASALS